MIRLGKVLSATGNPRPKQKGCSAIALSLPGRARLLYPFRRSPEQRAVDLELAAPGLPCCLGLPCSLQAFGNVLTWGLVVHVLLLLVPGGPGGVLPFAHHLRIAAAKRVLAEE